jgi:hypothetical protein
MSSSFKIATINFIPVSPPEPVWLFDITFCFQISSYCSTSNTKMVAPPTFIGVGEGNGRGEPSKGVAIYSTLFRQLLLKARTVASSKESFKPISKVALRRSKNPPVLGKRVREMPNFVKALTAFSASCSCTTTVIKRFIGLRGLYGFMVHTLPVQMNFLVYPN